MKQDKKLKSLIKTKIREFLNENEKFTDMSTFVNQIIDINKKMDYIIKSNGYNISSDIIISKDGSGAKTTVHDELSKEDKKYANLYSNWKRLINKVSTHYKNIISKTYNEYGDEKTKEMFYKIKDFLTKSEEYQIAAGVIMFDLTSFTINLIKKT
jgi:hypothetical protein